jgi:aromatic-amino-acid transaminase
MRDRIHSMRLQFVERIRARVPSADFGFVARQRGMFSYSGLSKDAVRRLREEFSIYAVDSGRICVAALNSHNLDYVSEAVARVII